MADKTNLVWTTESDGLLGETSRDSDSLEVFCFDETTITNGVAESYHGVRIVVYNVSSHSALDPIRTQDNVRESLGPVVEVDSI